MDAASARVLYNVFDALGAGDRDHVRAVEARVRHTGPAAVRRLWLALRWLDWEPRFTGRSRARFHWLRASDRRAAIERWRSSRLGWRRRAYADVMSALDAGESQPEGAA